jgi:hypothetical protein
MYSQKLLHEIEVLPPELQKQVYDFVLLITQSTANCSKKNGG